MAIIYQFSYFCIIGADLDGKTTNLYWLLHPKSFRTKISQKGYTATLKISVWMGKCYLKFPRLIKVVVLWPKQIHMI